MSIFGEGGVSINDSNQKIVTDNLVLHYDAAQLNSYSGSGTTWTDLSGLGNNGTLTNGPTFSSANGGSIVFDGVNDYVTSSFGSLSGSFDEFTVIVWFYPTSIASFRNVIDCNYEYNASTGNIGPRLEIETNGTLTWYFSNDVSDSGSYNYHIAATGSVASSSFGPILANTWHCAALTYSGSTSNAYYNGVISSNTMQSTGSSTGFIGTMNSVNIGRGNHLNSITGSFVGRVPIVQIYNKQLSASEIFQNFDSTKSRFYRIRTANLITCFEASSTDSYPGTGTSWFDISTTPTPLTLTNGPTFNSSNQGSIKFDGINDYAETSVNYMGNEIANKSFGGFDPFAFEFWCKINSYPTSGTNRDTIVKAGLSANAGTAVPTGTSVNYAFSDYADYPIVVSVYGNWGYNIALYPRTLVSDLNWHHWTATYYPGSGGSTAGQLCFLYIDGILKTRSGLPNQGGTFSLNAGPLTFARDPNFGHYANANIGEFRAYSAVPTAQQIFENYHATKSRYISI